MDEGVAEESDFEEPQPAADEDILLVHEPRWVHCLKHGTLSFHDILKLEIPYSRTMVDAFWLMAGGSIEAARDAVTRGVGFNIGGGFHHAFPGHGEGFCAIHDVAVAVRRLQRDAPDPHGDDRRYRRPPGQRDRGCIRGGRVRVHDIAASGQQLPV